MATVPASGQATQPVASRGEDDGKAASATGPGGGHDQASRRRPRWQLCQSYLRWRSVGANRLERPHSLQIYLDRWQIEVNHREEKDTLGVGQAQLWNPTAVPKQPALTVAAYSALLLASLQAFGAERGRAYAPLPRWRRGARRPSCLDLITLLRQEMVEHPDLLAPLDLPISHRSLTSAAAA